MKKHNIPEERQGEGFSNQFSKLMGQLTKTQRSAPQLLCIPCGSLIFIDAFLALFLGHKGRTIIGYCLASGDTDYLFGELWCY